MSSSCLPFQVAVGLSLSSNFSHCKWAAALQNISPKRIEEENPSAIFHSSPFSMSGWFIFAFVGSRHYTVYSYQRESRRETQMSSSFLPFPVAVGLSLSSNFSHCMWAAGTTVYFTKENRRENPKCHLPFFLLFNERWVYLCSQLLTLHVGSRHYSIFHQRESKRKTQMSSSILPTFQ
jgi:hypothetical protein